METRHISRVQAHLWSGPTANGEDTVWQENDLQVWLSTQCLRWSQHVRPKNAIQLAYFRSLLESRLSLIIESTLCLALT
jgi:hypothetical protein